MPGANPIVTFIEEGHRFSFAKEKNNHTDLEDIYLSEKNNNFPGPTIYHKNMHYAKMIQYFQI